MVKFIGLLQVTKITMHIAQIIVTYCHIDMFMSELFQANGKCTIIIFLCLLQVTKSMMHISQIIVTFCHIDMFRSELF